MTKRYTGGVVSSSLPTVNAAGASGVFLLSQQADYQSRNAWPPYKVEESLRFRSSASASLSRTPASATNRTTWTWSGWIKRGDVSTSEMTFFSAGTDNNNFTALAWNNNNLFFQNYTSGTQVTATSTAVFRDPSAWYHVVLAIDTTQATAADRAKIYVNGVQQAGFSGSSLTLNQQFWINFTYRHTISARSLSSIDSFTDQYMSEINFVDGQQLNSSYFGQTSAITGVWEPIKYTGTYGTNGFYLSLSDTSSIGKDFSGNGNNWTPNNISTANDSTFDLMRDVPTQYTPQGATDVGGVVRGNYATLNPLDAQGTATLSDANLTLASSTTAHKNRKATFVIPSTGKWYWELTTASTCSASVILGWGLQTTAAATDSQAGNADTFMAQNDANQDIWNQTTNTLSTGSAVAANAIRQVAYDADTGKIWFGINNVWYSSTDLTSGNPSAGTNQCITLSAGSYFPTITCYNLTANANFGQRPFTYTPPSGFKSLCTTNLPTPTIGATVATAANKNFDATLYTGTGATQTITNSGSMQPDFVWLKTRNQSGYGHELFDSVRGATKYLISNSTGAESTEATSLTAFNSNGFSVGSFGFINGSGDSIVGWQWRASNAAAVTNTNGSNTSSVSASTTAGFSIVTFTAPSSGQFTVGHGLGVTPDMVIVKNRTTGSTTWFVYHSSLGVNNTDYLVLNTTAAEASFSTMWGSGGMTSSTCGFTVGGSTYANDNHVAYCFTPIAGYSAFGSYTGNGSSDGPFIYTGFRPRFVMIKKTSDTGNWWMIDTARSTYNQMADVLLADSNGDEFASGTGWPGIDYLSNGFKLRGSATGINGSGATYIYMAFAETPFKNSLAR